MQGLGRLFNASTSATTTATPVSLVDATAVTIFGIGATSGAITITELTAPSGGTSQSYDGAAGHGAGVTVYYTWAAGVWTRRTQAAAATVTMVTGGLIAIPIDAAQLADGFKYVAASHSAASFILLTHDLEFGRKPANLRSNLA